MLVKLAQQKFSPTATRSTKTCTDFVKGKIPSHAEISLLGTCPRETPIHEHEEKYTKEHPTQHCFT